MTAPHLTDVGQGSPDWETPPALFALLHRRWLFDYDPFASHTNHKAPLYSTLEGTFRQTGPGPFDIERISPKNGLEYSWSGLRVFANPPYSRGVIDQCIDKAIAEHRNAACIVYLIPTATSTNWFHKLTPHGNYTFLPKRVAFIHPPHPCKPDCAHALSEPITNPPSGMMVFEFGTPFDWWKEVL